ncbi:hypothetical protein ACLOJK_014758 [Asimina triloba]
MAALGKPLEGTLPDSELLLEGGSAGGRREDECSHVGSRSRRVAFDHLSEAAGDDIAGLRLPFTWVHAAISWWTLLFMIWIRFITIQIDHCPFHRRRPDLG